MILRKPYALFIKYFKLINLIMAILAGFLAYKTAKIGHFFTTYIRDYTTATNAFSMDKYISVILYLAAIVIIIGAVAVLSVLFVKKKPKKLYILTLIIYIIALAIFSFDQNILNTISKQVLDVRVSKAMRDINYIALGAELIIFVLILIRATGFDIKNFDFATDLQKLDINTKDNEEFEVAVEFDKNKTRRNVRKKIRQIKYLYLEHKFIFNVSALAMVIIIIGVLVVNKIMYTTNYNQGKIFQVGSLNLSVADSYITQTDQNGNTVVNDGYLLVVRLDVKTLLAGDDQQLNTGLFTLNVGNKTYYQTRAYHNYITDLGTGYIDQELTNDYESYLLVYKIPKEQKDDTIKLKVNDYTSYVGGKIGAKNIYIKLKPQDLTEKTKTNQINIGETLSFSGSLLGETTLNIEQVEVGSKFKEEYTYCASSTNCYKSYEYITPTATGNYFKTLLKIEGDYELDDDLNLENVDDLYYFLNQYATINYKIGNDWYSHKINSKLIKPKAVNNDSYYIEVNKDIEKSNSKYLTFKVRNYTYKYMLK